MKNLRREPMKYVRDFIKKDYKARDCCYICGSIEHLDLHHLYSLSELFNQWCAKNSIPDITNEEQIMLLRVQFAKDCADRLSNDNLYTLCKHHHIQLHSLYGQRYANHMAPKVKNWIEIQRNKFSSN
jgi:5-methylcytosine-specific restriction endonuclease McrA